jgi:hypothetical protein
MPAVALGDDHHHARERPEHLHRRAAIAGSMLLFNYDSTAFRLRRKAALWTGK